jgi:hypothetical protein
MLAIVDSLLILFATLDYSVVRAFNLHFDWYGRTFPLLIYPTTNIILCASVFVVVSIAYERYTAVCHPYDYRAAISTTSVGRRGIRFAVPVLVSTL